MHDPVYLFRVFYADGFRTSGERSSRKEDQDTSEKEASEPSFGTGDFQSLQRDTGSWNQCGGRSGHHIKKTHLPELLIYGVQFRNGSCITRFAKTVLRERRTLRTRMWMFFELPKQCTAQTSCLSLHGGVFLLRGIFGALNFPLGDKALLLEYSILNIPVHVVGTNKSCVAL
jgi:hypothetical protein